MKAELFEKVCGYNGGTVESIELVGSYLRPKIVSAHNVSDTNIYEYAAKCKIHVFKKYGIVIESGVFNDVMYSSVSGFASCSGFGNNEGLTVQADIEARAVIEVAERIYSSLKREQK